VLGPATEGIRRNQRKGNENGEKIWAEGRRLTFPRFVTKRAQGENKDGAVRRTTKKKEGGVRSLIRTNKNSSREW